ncbi:MAG: hypothetical protein LBK13_07415 [Spirochaetales bacterium]|jgi:hypothetical protein|nr:hypothetical protein [Spirochaetales bacterium]
MKYIFLIIFLSVSVNIFSQLNKEEIIKEKIIQIINSYEENEIMTEYEQFRNIIDLLKYIFIQQNKNITLSNENGLRRMNFHENELKLNIIPRFWPMHLTGSFTYCTGTLSMNNNLSFDFYLYENNKYSREYTDIINNNNLSFCFFDTNDPDYAYFNIFKPNEDEIFTVNKYENIEDFLEIPDSRIMTIIYYKKMM